MLTIYHAVGTRSLRVIWTCEELKIPYQVETIPFTAEYRASQEWRKMNPVGKVPVLKDDDFIMFESGAIVHSRPSWKRSIAVKTRHTGARPLSAVVLVRRIHFCKTDWRNRQPPQGI